MEPAPHEVVTRHRDVEVVRATAPSDAAAALFLLDQLGADAEAPVVDEAERARLEGLAEGGAAADHEPALIRRGGRLVGYLGVAGRGADVRGDLAVDRADGDPSCLVAGLDAAAELGRALGGKHLELWLRRSGDEVVDRAVAQGFAIERRLAVLGRSLEGAPTAAPTPEGVAIRGFRDGDEREVVELLAEAYAGTAEAGWDLEAFRARQAYDWFDPEDLLLAVDASAGIVGLHWTKRRGNGVGEVYNLAVAPRARGRGLGHALLTAGLAHLRRRGADEVLLWVDTANEPAMQLYTTHGFAVRWEDIAVGRDLSSPQPASEASPRRPGGTTL